MKKQLIAILTVLAILTCFIGKVDALDKNESITDGGDGDGDGFGGENVKTCGLYNGSQSTGYLGIKLTVEWRYYTTKKEPKIKQIGKTVYVPRKGTSMSVGNEENAKVYAPTSTTEKWFGSNAVDYDAMDQYFIGDKKSGKNLKSWLKIIVGDNYEKELQEYAEKSCKLDHHNADNCKGKDGLRLVVENVVFTKGACW